ncbi:MAG: hypothetical protein ACRD15_07890 [Vicinamibacterales bacterium]
MTPVMFWRTLAATFAFAATIVVAAPAGAEGDVSVSLSAHVARAPATLQLRVRVPPHARNRLLRVSLDSGSYYRSSDVPLEGNQAPATHVVRWPGVPSGVYGVAVEVFQSNGRSRVVYGGSVQVIGL